MGEECCSSCCSTEATKTAEDQVRDLINLINVKKSEDAINAEAAAELVAKLEELAKAVGNVCE